MRITSHASCGPIVHICADGTVHISRMEYRKNGRVSLRHIMETGKNDQTVSGTLREGVLKEGAKDRENFHIDVLTTEPIHFQFVNDEKTPGGTQMKVVFPVSVPIEELRDISKLDDDNPDEEHGPIQLVEITQLIAETQGENGRYNTVPFHFEATLATLSWAAKDQKVLNKYYSFISQWQPHTLNDEERAAVVEYRTRW